MGCTVFLKKINTNKFQYKILVSEICPTHHLARKDEFSFDTVMITSKSSEIETATSDAPGIDSSFFSSSYLISCYSYDSYNKILINNL